MTQLPKGSHAPDDDALTLFCHLTDTTPLELAPTVSRGCGTQVVCQKKTPRSHLQYLK